VITVKGEMESQLRREFEDLELTVDRGVTHLRAVGADASMLNGLIRRIEVLGLELLHIDRIEDGPLP
jgi:hypothetical protein